MDTWIGSGGRPNRLPFDLIFSFALLASTYGWTHREILDLTARQFFAYLKQIGLLNAQQQLRMFEVVAFPHMDKSKRQSLLNAYKRYFPRVSLISSKKDVDSAWNMLRSEKGKAF